MEIEFEITKNKMYLFLGALVILISIIGISAYNTNDPSYFGHSAGEIEGLSPIPSGFCIFSDTATDCPEGFSEDLEFQNKTLRVDKNNLGETGGSDFHNHNVNKKSYKHALSEGSNRAASIEPASSWPPYINVIVCCKD